MNKFIRVIENSWTDDITFLVPYQVIDENDYCYMIFDDLADANWVEEEYCEEVSVECTVIKSKKQKEIEEFTTHIDDFENGFAISEALAEYLYNQGYRKTK